MANVEKSPKGVLGNVLRILFVLVPVILIILCPIYPSRINLFLGLFCFFVVVISFCFGWWARRDSFVNRDFLRFFAEVLGAFSLLSALYLFASYSNILNKIELDARFVGEKNRYFALIRHVTWDHCGGDVSATNACCYQAGVVRKFIQKDIYYFSNKDVEDNKLGVAILKTTCSIDKKNFHLLMGLESIALKMRMLSDEFTKLDDRKNSIESVSEGVVKSFSVGNYIFAALVILAGGYAAIFKIALALVPNFNRVMAYLEKTEIMGYRNEYLL